MSLIVDTTSPGNYQSRLEIKPGKFAYIQTPHHKDKAKAFLAAALDKWRPPSWYFHYSNGGHVAAIKHHLPNRLFAHLDIGSFFNSVTKTKIIRSLKRIGYSFQEADEAAVESTVRIDGKFVLPYGFAQSPYLASLALAKSDLGHCFRDIRQTNLFISIYVDDVILSSPDDDTNALDAAIDQISEAAERSHFKLNADKYSGPSSSVTAFNIVASHQSMVISSDRLLEFRARLSESTSIHSAMGMIRYVNSVNAGQAQQLADEFGYELPHSIDAQLDGDFVILKPVATQNTEPV